MGTQVMSTDAMGTQMMGTQAMGTQVKLGEGRSSVSAAVRDGNGKVNGMKGRLLRILIVGLALMAVGVPGLEGTAQAQEILVSGPLAGAPAVRKQRLYRQLRFEIAPQASFTLLDEYQRLIFLGARLNFNVTDWLAIGVWGAFAPIKPNTGLTDRIQDVNTRRKKETAAAGNRPTIDHRLTAANVSNDFTKQLGTIDWVAAPQLTLVPFRGKIGLFQSIYIDTDLYLFGGPAFVGVKERADCKPSGPACAPVNGAGTAPFKMASRMAIAPTFGLGFQFYFSGFGAVGVEWRGLPFARNTGGFDNHGGGPNEEFPDRAVDSKDREFKFNQMIGISLGISLPFDYKVSE
jgi:hypothetical protein